MQKKKRGRTFDSPRSKSRRRDSWEDRESRDMKRDDARKSSNDPRWYATDDALLRDSASIPFSWPLGQPFNMEPERVSRLGIQEDPISLQTYTVPGLCALEIAPSMGAGLNSDALNVAASSIYTYVRHTNAGHANYDPNDLMLYIIAMTQIYSGINYMQRLYALASSYDQKNRYLPRAIFKAMNCNPDSFINNLADYRYRLNVLINKVSALAVPATMTLFLREAMLYSYIYCESENIKDQLYFYYPNGFYRFELDSDGAGMLAYTRMWTTISTHPYNYTDVISYFEDLYNQIWEQEDFGIMSGDILKSYGDNILKLQSVDEVLPFAPVYDPMVLHQIKNATVVHPIVLNGSNNFDIKQNAAKNKLKCHVYMSGSNEFESYVLTYNASKPKVLTLDSVNPTPEMVIEATRLMVTVSEVITEGQASPIVSLACGSEICMGAHLITYNIDSDTIDTIECGVYLFDDSLTGIMYMARIAKQIARIKAFKFAPTAYYLFTEVGSNRIVDGAFIEEVDNYAVLNNEDVSKMHTAAMLNLLNVPSTAKAVTVRN